MCKNRVSKNVRFKKGHKKYIQKLYTYKSMGKIVYTKIVYVQKYGN